jgi:hypothetical protein
VTINVPSKEFHVYLAGDWSLMKATLYYYRLYEKLVELTTLNIPVPVVLHDIYRLLLTFQIPLENEKMSLKVLKF